MVYYMVANITQLTTVMCPAKEILAELQHISFWGICINNGEI